MIKGLSKSLCLLALLCLFINTCFAESENSWKPLSTIVINGQTADFLIDSKSYKIHNEPDKYIDCWLKSTSETGTVFQHFFIKENLNYLINEYVAYDKDGRQIQSDNRQYEGWKQTAPYSKLGHLLMDIVVWAEKKNQEKADENAISNLKKRVSITKTNMDATNLSLIGLIKQVIVTSHSNTDTSPANSKVFRFSRTGLLNEEQELKKGKLTDQIFYDDAERMIEMYSIRDGYKKRMMTYLYDDKNKTYKRFTSMDIEEGTLDDYGNIATRNYGEGKVFVYSFTYDARGRKIQSTEGSLTSDFEYDKDGRIYRIFGKVGEITYEYDSRGSLIKYVRNINAEPTLVVMYTNLEFDNYGNWTRRTLTTEVNGEEKLSMVQTRTIEYY